MGRQDSGTSKGVGYITYAAKEDAEKAVAELNNGAFGDSSRKIRVEWAEQKVRRRARISVRVLERREAHPSDRL